MRALPTTDPVFRLDGLWIAARPPPVAGPTNTSLIRVRESGRASGEGLGRWSSFESQPFVTLLERQTRKSEGNVERLTIPRDLHAVREL